MKNQFTTALLNAIKGLPLNSLDMEEGDKPVLLFVPVSPQNASFDAKTARLDNYSVTEVYKGLTALTPNANGIVFGAVFPIWRGTIDALLRALIVDFPATKGDHIWTAKTERVAVGQSGETIEAEIIYAYQA